MSEPFASVRSYERDFGPVAGEGERERVERALSRASSWLRLQLDVRPPYSEDYRALLETVTVSLARRYLDARSGNAGPTAGGAALTQFTQTAGSYSVSGTMLNPGNALWLTNQEREALGIGGCSAFGIQTGGEDCGHRH